MTNEQWIKQLGRKELAERLIKSSYREDWDYDYDEEPFFWGIQEVYITSDGCEFVEDYDAALQQECWWLAQEKE